MRAGLAVFFALFFAQSVFAAEPTQNCHYLTDQVLNDQVKVLYSPLRDPFFTWTNTYNTYKNLDQIQKLAAGKNDSTIPSAKIISLAEEAYSSGRKFCFRLGTIKAFGIEIGSYIDEAHLGPQ